MFWAGADTATIPHSSKPRTLYAMQTHSKSYKLLFLSLFLNSICIGQSLDFKTIQSFFSLDSNLIQTKCAEKGFILDSIENGKYQTIYFFTQKNNKKIKVRINYTTKDNPSSNLFQYTFQSELEYKDFIEEMTENGFTSTELAKQDKFGGQFFQSLYHKKNITVSLGVFKVKKKFQSYILTYFLNAKK